MDIHIIVHQAVAILRAAIPQEDSLLAAVIRQVDSHQEDFLVAIQLVASQDHQIASHQAAPTLEAQDSADHRAVQALEVQVSAAQVAVSEDSQEEVC